MQTEEYLDLKEDVVVLQEKLKRLAGYCERTVDSIRVLDNYHAMILSRINLLEKELSEVLDDEKRRQKPG